MALLDFGGTGKGLLGLGGMGGMAGGNMGGLLQTPEMKKNMLKNALMQAGIGLMQTGQVGSAAAQGLLGAQQAREAYVNDARMAYDMNRQQRQDAMQNTEYLWRLSDRDQEERQRKAREAWLEGLPEDQQGLAQAYPDLVAKQIATQKIGGGVEYGLNPVWLQNPETGQWMLAQPSKDGSAPKPMAFPDGYVPAPPNMTIDTGTGTYIIPSRGSAPNVGTTIPKDIAGVEGQKVTGKSQAEISFELPKAEMEVNADIAKIDEVINHPGLNKGTGTWQGSKLGSAVMPLFSNDVADFQRRVDQLKGGAFLQAYQTLKGGGNIANAEGTKAEMAIARLNTAVSEKDFKEALEDYKTAIRRGLAAMRVQSGMTADPPAAQDGVNPLPSMADPSDPLGLRRK